LEQKHVFNDNTDISEDNLPTGISSAVLIISKSKAMLSASNIEKLIAQLGKNQDGSSTLLLRRALGSIMDMNVDHADELELLHDFRMATMI
jgi:hypothetical protein